jgi:hypothetical protein
MSNDTFESESQIGGSGVKKYLKIRLTVHYLSAILPRP